MTIKYSPVSGAFYATAFGGTIPSDAFEVGNHSDLIEHRAKGGRLAVVNGAVVMQPADLPAFASLKAAEFDAFRAKRAEFLNRMTWVASDFAALKTPAGDAAAANARAINNALLNMLTDAAIVAAADIVALRLAMKTRYRAITYPVASGGTALPEVVAAYKKVDA